MTVVRLLQTGFGFKRIFPLLLFFLLGFLLWPQELPTEPVSPDIENPADEANSLASEEDTAKDDTDEEAEDPEKPEQPKISIEELDIRTASLLELAAWTRELGLSESGTREALQQRLRTYYKLTSSQTKAEAEGRVVVIESARNTEYFTVETIGEEYARLSGKVIVSFTDKDVTHRIEADEILYNRSTNTMTANGSVQYRKEDGDALETFSGDSLTVDVDNWSGLFLGGASEKSQKGDTQAYRFLAETIDRSQEGVTVLSKAVVENAASEEAFWSVRASKIWLMPGSDWAVFNAVLSVGEVPLLYVPFFFLPGDELVFHPVFGYRSREGSFIQTTTYLLGRPKPSSSESSIMKILEGDSDQELRRDGLYLRKTGEKAKSSSGNNLALLFDVYSNLGAYFGVEATLPKSGSLSATTISGGLLVSRTVFRIGAEYSPYTSTFPDGQWNWSNLFGIEVPFRYRLKANGGFNIGKFTITWTMPFYSDPYTDHDTMNRSEKMDWFNMVKAGASALDSDDSLSMLSSYEWKIGSSWTPDVKALNPWINSFRITNMSSSLKFSYKADAARNSYDPRRNFFYPDSLSIFSLSSSLGGKLLSSNSSSSTTGSSTSQQRATTADVSRPLELSPRSPWDEELSPVETIEEERAADATALAALNNIDIAAPISDVKQSFTLRGGVTKPSWDVTYSLTPSFVSQLDFLSENWATNAEINWSQLKSLFSNAKLSGNLSGKYTAPGGVFSGSAELSASSAWQDYHYINEEAAEFNTESERSEASLRNRKATTASMNANVSLKASPFDKDSVFSASNISWSLKGLLAKLVYSETLSEWDWTLQDWTEDTISSHALSASFSAKIRDHQQSLSLSASLPPKTSSLTANANMNIGISTTTANITMKNLFEDFLLEPISFAEKLVWSSTQSYSQTLVWDTELQEITQANSSLKLGDFSLDFKALRSGSYSLDFNESGKPLGWVYNDSVQQLNPKDLIVGYDWKSGDLRFWKNRFLINTSIENDLTVDFQRFTMSAYTLKLNLTLKLHEFLDVTFSSVSRNQVLYRYLAGVIDYGFNDYIIGEQNVFVDLFNSFAFWDDSLRQSSGFKLRSLSVALIHHMGDWTAKLNWSVSPYLDKTGAQSNWSYKFDNKVAFVVQWTPISELKTDISADKAGFVIN